MIFPASHTAASGLHFVGLVGKLMKILKLNLSVCSNDNMRGYYWWTEVAKEVWEGGILAET